MKDIAEVSVETWQHRLAKGGGDAAKTLSRTWGFLLLFWFGFSKII